MTSKSVFQGRGINVGVTKLEDGRFRFEASKNETRFSEAFTYDELRQLLEGSAQFMTAPPEEPDDGRFDRVSQVLRDYAASEGKTIEAIDRECQVPAAQPGAKGRIMSREEYLQRKIGKLDLEEVLAGKMTVAEAIRHQGEDEGAEDVGLDEGEEGPEFGQVN